jgi:hypothetical protein
MLEIQKLYIVECLVVALVIVVLDESGNGLLKLPGK